MGQLRSAIRALAGAQLGAGAAARPARRLRGAPARRAQFATIAYAEVALATGEMRYACAGHPPPVLLAPGGAPALLWDGPLAAAGRQLRRTSAPGRGELVLPPGRGCCSTPTASSSAADGRSTRASSGSPPSSRVDATSRCPDSPTSSPTRCCATSAGTTTCACCASATAATRRRRCARGPTTRESSCRRRSGASTSAAARSAVSGAGTLPRLDPAAPGAAERDGGGHAAAPARGAGERARLGPPPRTPVGGQRRQPALLDRDDVAPVTEQALGHGMRLRVADDDERGIACLGEQPSGARRVGGVGRSAPGRSSGRFGPARRRGRWRGRPAVRSRARPCLAGLPSRGTHSRRPVRECVVLCRCPSRTTR